MDKILFFILYRRHKKRKLKRWWVHPLNLRRLELGEHIKIEEMMRKYPEHFQNYTRLTPLQFQEVLSMVSSRVEKLDTNYRPSLSPSTRLFVTLRYLATGDNIKSIATSYSIGVSTVRSIIHETTLAIWDSVGKVYVKPPSSPDEWNKIADDFYESWKFPNCIGAIDGKHVIVVAPNNSGSQFYNYKGTFSIVLMATCDAHNRFTTIDVGAYRRQSDGGVFASSALGQLLEKGKAGVGGSRKLPNSSIELPLTFVGDEAFPLKTYLMRPYPGKELNLQRRIYNYRLSRARRTIENCFGILSSRFQVFRNPIHASAARVSNIIKATISIHNYLRSKEIIGAAFVSSSGTEACEQENVFVSITRTSSNMYSKAAKEMREQFASYFLSSGAVEWQLSAVSL